VLMNYHIGRLVLSSLCVGDLVRLVLGGGRFAGICKVRFTAVSPFPLRNFHLGFTVCACVSL
jgi:hypothetical protein